MVAVIIFQNKLIGRIILIILHPKALFYKGGYLKSRLFWTAAYLSNFFHTKEGDMRRPFWLSATLVNTVFLGLLKNRECGRKGVLLLIMIILASCVPIDVKKNQEILTYSQNQEHMHSVFKLKIEEVFWTDVETKIGQHSGSHMKSLVINLSTTNTGKEPLRSKKPIVFRLKSEEGVEYAVRGMGGAWGGPLTPGLNPNMPNIVRLVFDVPMGNNYYLVVSEGVWEGGMVSQREPMFRWKLFPVEK